MFEMEWSGDGDGTDYSTTSSPPRRPGEARSEGVRCPTAGAGADMDSLSEEMDDDLMSDDFSLPESDDEEDDDSRRDSTTPGGRYSCSASTSSRWLSSKSKSHYDRRPVGQCVLVSSPVWGS
jgi:hypothetical protein